MNVQDHKITVVIVTCTHTHMHNTMCIVMYLNAKCKAKTGRTRPSTYYTLRFVARQNGLCYKGLIIVLGVVVACYAYENRCIVQYYIHEDVPYTRYSTTFSPLSVTSESSAAFITTTILLLRRPH